MDWENTLKIMAPPKSEGHIRTLPKEKQEQVSAQKRETCDYCHRAVVLDCRRCGQKLCERHLSKPCR